MRLHHSGPSYFWKRALGGWLAWTLSTSIGAVVGLFLIGAFWGVVLVLLVLLMTLIERPLGVRLLPFPPGPWNAAITTSLVAAIAGGCFGIGQIVPLRTVLATNVGLSWVGLSVVGAWVAGLVVGLDSFVPNLWPESTLMTLGLVAGGVLGMAQWVALRPHTNMAWVWVPTTALSLFAGTSFLQPESDASLTSVIVAVLIFSMASGVVMVWLSTRHVDGDTQPGVQSIASQDGPGALR